MENLRKALDSLQPWKNEKPYYIGEDGCEWYVDKKTTDYCTEPTVNDLENIDAVCFFVVSDGRLSSRVLIDEETNNVLADENSLEAMSAQIDMMRITKTVLKHEESN